MKSTQDVQKHEQVQEKEQIVTDNPEPIDTCHSHLSSAAADTPIWAPRPVTVTRTKQDNQHPTHPGPLWNPEIPAVKANQPESDSTRLCKSLSTFPPKPGRKYGLQLGNPQDRQLFLSGTPHEAATRVMTRDIYSTQSPVRGI